MFLIGSGIPPTLFSPPAPAVFLLLVLFVMEATFMPMLPGHFFAPSPRCVPVLTGPDGGDVLAPASIEITGSVAGSTVSFILQCRSRVLVGLLGQCLNNPFSCVPSAVASTAVST